MRMNYSLFKDSFYTYQVVLIPINYEKLKMYIKQKLRSGHGITITSSTVHILLAIYCTSTEAVSFQAPPLTLPPLLLILVVNLWQHLLQTFVTVSVSPAEKHLHH